MKSAGLVLFLGFLVVPGLRFLLLQSRPLDRENARTFFEFRSQRESEPGSDRPSDIGTETWIALGHDCGVSVEQEAQQDEILFRGQLICRISGEWHRVFLKDAPPSTFLLTK
jgi:hypothetical protein